VKRAATVGVYSFSLESFLAALHEAGVRFVHLRPAD